MEIKKEIRNFLSMLCGCMILSLTFTVLCVPNNYVVGGVSGIGVIFNYLFDIKVSYTLLIGNLIITAIGIIVLGLKDTYRSIIGAIVYTFTIYISELLAPMINIDFSSVFIKVIVIGVLFGISCTLVYLANYTTGGIDILGLIINLY